MFRKILTTFKDTHLTFSQRKRLISSGNGAGSRLNQEDNQKSGDQLIDLNTYSKASDETLEKLSENLESILEDRYDRGADVRLESGVLTVVVDPSNTYVINKQTPNRQIWLSSPLSGPKRFDLDPTGRWFEKRSKIELNRLLSEELSSLIKSKVEC